MTTPPALERRMGQRFAFNLPVSLHDVSTEAEGLGFTQDVSSRGVFLFTDMGVNEGCAIELTLRMPSEITLGEAIRVRCKGRVLRVIRPLANGANPAVSPQDKLSADAKFAETKLGVAVCLNGYDYLPQTADDPPEFRRISALHGASENADESGTRAVALPATLRNAAD
jgi:PilZ domain